MYSSGAVILVSVVHDRTSYNYISWQGGPGDPVKFPIRPGTVVMEHTFHCDPAI